MSLTYDCLVMLQNSFNAEILSVVTACEIWLPRMIPTYCTFSALHDASYTMAVPVHEFQQEAMRLLTLLLH